MQTKLIEYLRCPVTGLPLELREVTEESESGGIVEGVLVEPESGRSYYIHESLPVLLPKGRRAVDDFATLLAIGAEDHGFAEAVRMLADGEIAYPLRETLGLPVNSIERREAAERATEAFWDTFSRQRLVQQQLNAIDQHWDALEELWLRADINLVDSILDVGTGWGGTFQHLLERGPQDAFVAGIDTSFLNLQIARGRAERAGYDHAHSVVGDVTEPPFPDESFESVVSWFGLGTVPLLTRGLEAAYRLLAPGFAFAAAWTPTIFADMEGLAGPDVLARLSARLDIPQSPDMAAEAARAVGFADVEVIEAGPVYVLRGRRPV